MKPGVEKIREKKVCTHQLPAGVTRLHARLAEVDEDHFTHISSCGLGVERGAEGAAGKEVAGPMRRASELGGATAHAKKG